MKIKWRKWNVLFWICVLFCHVSVYLFSVKCQQQELPSKFQLNIGKVDWNILNSRNDFSKSFGFYADDATIMSFIKSSEDRLPAAASLNQDLAKIETWAKTWNVLFGAAKCKTTTISNCRDADGNHPPLHFFAVTLKEADGMDLLGLTLNNNLSWNQVVTKISKTACQRLGLLRRVSPYILPAQRVIIYNKPWYDQNGIC